MKKVKSDELRREYRREDLGKGVRGKYLKAYRAQTKGTQPLSSARKTVAVGDQWTTNNSVDQKN